MNRLSLCSFLISLMIHVPLVYGIDVPFIRHGAVPLNTDATDLVVYYIPPAQTMSHAVKNGVSQTDIKCGAETVSLAGVPMDAVRTRADALSGEQVRYMSELMPVLGTIDPRDTKTRKRFIDYYEYLREQIERRAIYPRAAQQQQREGSVYLSFGLRQDGTVSTICVVRSSGVVMLDDAAMQSVRTAAPFSPFPAAVTEPEIRVNIPITFELGKD